MCKSWCFFCNSLGGGGSRAPSSPGAFALALFCEEQHSCLRCPLGPRAALSSKVKTFQSLCNMPPRSLEGLSEAPGAQVGSGTVSPPLLGPWRGAGPASQVFCGSVGEQPPFCKTPCYSPRGGGLTLKAKPWALFLPAVLRAPVGEAAVFPSPHPYNPNL